MSKPYRNRRKGASIHEIGKGLIMSIHSGEILLFKFVDGGLRVMLVHPVIIGRSLFERRRL